MPPRPHRRRRPGRAARHVSPQNDMDPPPDVKHVVLFAATGGGSLLLVECADGTLRILRDEQPVDGCHWDPTEMSQAAGTFHRMVRELGRQD